MKKSKNSQGILIKTRRKILSKIIFLLIIIPSLIFLYLWIVRPSRSFYKKRITAGVEYFRIPKEVPRPLMIHILEISMNAPGLKPYVTPGMPEVGLKAQTVSEFMKSSGVKIGINANYFSPHYVNSVFDYYPHSGDIVQPSGIAISMGEAYSKIKKGKNTLCISNNQKLKIVSEECPKDTLNAVSGGVILLKSGQVNQFPVTENDKKELYHPRSAIGFDENMQKIWLVVVDGRQKYYSEGMSLEELAMFMKELGATEALELDGGGSSALGINTEDGVEILNSPIEAGIYGRERPVANHLGFFVELLGNH